MCAYYIRFIRSTLLEQYQTPIVESSRLRGMPERYILFQDILKSYDTTNHTSIRIIHW